MRMIYFVQYFLPEKASGLPLVLDMLEGFAKHGWKVDVYIPTPTRGVSDDVRKEYAKKRTERCFDGKLTIHRMHLYREGTGMLQRTIRYCIFSLQCLLRGLFVPADAIFTGGGPPTQGIVAGLIHKWTKKKVIFNPQDLFPDSLVISGVVSESSKIVRIGRVMERFSYDNADSIITITEDMADNIRSKIKEPDKVHVIRNWVDTDKIHPIAREDNELFDELSLPHDRFYVTYAGNIGLMQGIETIIFAAEQLQEMPDIQFVLFGNGSEETNIRQLIAKKRLTNVRLFPLQSAERVSEVYSLGDVSIVSCKPGTGSAGMPSKTWTIMACGAAIIGSFDLNCEFTRTIEAAQCGLCAEAGNARALADAILQMYNAPKQKEVFRNRARQYAETQVSKKNAVSKYIAYIEETVSANASTDRIKRV